MSNELVLDSNLASSKNLAWWLYLAHAISFLFSLGLLSFLPLIINYLKRGDTTGTFVHSHHSWQIRSFWWYLLWMAVGALLFMTIVGIPIAWLVWICAWLWKAYRLLKGIIDLNSHQSMPV
jgi:uncharacterized membrane protein